MAPHMRDSAHLRATAPLAPSLSISDGRRLCVDFDEERTERSGDFASTITSMLAAAVILSLLAAPVATVAMTNGWPIETTLRHFAAAPSCQTARAVGLAPARTGQPGYWLWLDRDHNGVSCEADAP